jgi:hypothetical protein
MYGGRTGGPEGICLLEGMGKEASSQSSLYLKTNECLVALPFPSVKGSFRYESSMREMDVRGEPCRSVRCLPACVKVLPREVPANAKEKMK